MNQNLLVIGDSWSNARVALPGGGSLDFAGWPLQMGIAPYRRRAVVGTTVVQWATDWGGLLTGARRVTADVVIGSLLGNDAMKVVHEGGVVTPEMVAAGEKMLVDIIRVLGRKRTIMLLYTDPYNGTQPGIVKMLPMLNGTISAACATAGAETFDTRTVLRPEHFIGVNGHPNLAGHRAIAKGLAAMLASGAV